MHLAGASAAGQRRVRYQTAGPGNDVTTAMADTGTLQALTLDAAGRVDKRRELVLRTASDFDQQRDGISATESLAETKTAETSDAGAGCRPSRGECRRQGTGREWAAARGCRRSGQRIA